MPRREVRAEHLIAIVAALLVIFAIGAARTPFRRASSSARPARGTDRGSS
jgi:hypothetical protein